MNAIHDDEDLLERLRAICEEVDPTLDLVIEMARAAFSLRRLDAELAELVLDSADEAAGAVAVRAAGLADIRMLSFVAGPLRIELQVTERDGWRHLVAHVTGVELSAAVLETATTRRALETEDGVLIAEHVAAGCRQTGSAPRLCPASADGGGRGRRRGPTGSSGRAPSRDSRAVGLRSSSCWPLRSPRPAPRRRPA